MREDDIMKKSKIEKDKVTIEKMINLYCKDQHGSKDELCQDCSELLEYSWKRLELCRQGKNKPTCGKCPIHCYKPDMRERVRKVMRYAGPRMLIYHPLEALRHLFQSLSS